MKQYEHIYHSICQKLLVQIQSQSYVTRVGITKRVTGTKHHPLMSGKARPADSLRAIMFIIDVDFMRRTTAAHGVPTQSTMMIPVTTGAIDFNSRDVAGSY